MSASPAPYLIELAHATPASLGESPLWDAATQSLFFVDIPERRVLRLQTETGELRQWQLDSEPGCIALIEGGGLLVAQRNGLWRLDTETGAHTQVAAAPFDSAAQRFNDGKPDAQGRFWVGTIDDARLPHAGLYRYAGGAMTRMADGIVTSNGAAWSPDATRMYWSDTKAHEIYVLSFDAQSGSIGERQLFAKFPPRAADQPLETYAGRPDGAAVDVEGCYWVAMFEGQRLLRLSPEGAVLSDIALPVRCPTMPAFGGADLRTLYITTARAGRSAEELAAQPWAGCVLQLRVDVPGLAPNRVKL
nr:SMP-30/gluconolactonase/LRE family protein [uncultured Roseateles sp.]